MGSRVILADDSVTIQKVVGIIFANEGYDLTIVSTGDAAVARAREIKPDVMLVDALMPGKNGYEVCREIRQDPALAHTGILLMTGAFEVVDEEKNRQSGADGFITKPFESQSLIDATNRLIAVTAERLSRSAAVSAPAAVPAAPQTAAAPAPPAAPAVDDIWATGFDDEPAAAPAAPVSFAAAAPSFAPVAPEPVKAASDDDLWGAFDMDDFETASEPVAVAPVPLAAAAAADEFSFDMEPPAAAADEFLLEDVVFEQPLATAAPTATGFEPFGEQELSFADMEPAPSAQPAATLSAEDDFGDISFDEPAVPAAAVPPLMPAGEPTPLEPSAPVFAAAVEPPPVAAPPAAAPQPAAPTAAAGSLDEGQLRELLSRVSREVIERIVWEVVPDLAETIIKEEIRKLKAGTA